MPCGTGTLWCLTATNSTDWWSGRGDPGDGASYDLTTYCPNPCIKDIHNGYWAPTDYNYTRYLFRPYCGSAASCGVYVYQSWVNSNGTTIAPTSNSSGLNQTSSGSFLSALTQRGPTGTLPPYPIGQTTSYNYIIASGVSCSGCPFNTGGCELVNWVPPTPPCTLVCLNGGMCVVDTNGTSYCQCLDIWTGSKCESLMLGLAAICLFEFAYLAVRLFHVICMNEEAVHTLMDRHSVEQAKKNCFNVPTVCPEDHPLGR
uniref:EGF-like domain-containing protein n=1 Tax=Acrobeloides nanus TaxID=290746 RepID=A0A914DD83_9BILA